MPILEAAVPGWVGPTMALSLVVIATVLVGVVAGLLVAVRALRQSMDGQRQAFADVAADVRRLVTSLEQMTERGRHVLEKLEHEASAWQGTSQSLRDDVEHAARGVRRRAADLAALYDVMQEEVEETALSVASTLRRVRGGAGMIGRVRRFLVRRR